MWSGEHTSCTRQYPCDQMNNKKNSSGKQVVSDLIYMETVTSESESHDIMAATSFLGVLRFHPVYSS